MTRDIDRSYIQIDPRGKTQIMQVSYKTRGDQKKGQENIPFTYRTTDTRVRTITH